jgi:hypothetical protein
MAHATRPAVAGAQSVEFGQRATGADAGSVYLKSLVLVQRSEEEDVQFLGRQERALEAVFAMLGSFGFISPSPPPAGVGDVE